MIEAYVLLGLLFVLVFLGAYLIFERAEAPTINDMAPIDAGENG